MLRPLSFTPHYQQNPLGSVLVELGHTKVLCSATTTGATASFLRGTGNGWLRAEYSMLPGAASERTAREAIRGHQDGRSQEIQRLIGRSLRSVLDLRTLQQRTMVIDCDVLNADGGTRTAAINGGFVALALALNAMFTPDRPFPLTDLVAAVSVGLNAEGAPILDLDYSEDSNAIVDCNVVGTASGDLIEIQGSGEGRPFTRGELDALLALATAGIAQVIAVEREILGERLCARIARAKADLAEQASSIRVVR